jgi:hypothetical protein
MSAKTGSAPFSPIDLSAEPIDLKPEDVPFPSWEPSARKRPRALARFSIAFCTGIAGTLLWQSYQSYGDAARQMIANLYSQLGWLTPRDATTVQKAPDTIAPTASDAPHPDQRQLDAALGDLHAMRLSLDQIAAGQELITRSIDEIATRITAGQQMTRSTDQTASSIAAAQEATTRSTNQTAATIDTGQEMTRNTDQAATSIDQAPSKATSIPVESRGDAAPLQPTVRLNIKPTGAKPAQTLSEKGKPPSAAGGHDPSCFPSASAVLQNHPGGWPTWTLKAPGHEGTQCWHDAARPRTSERRSTASDHQMEMMPRDNGTVEATEKGLLAPPASYGRGGSWEGGLP